MTKRVIEGKQSTMGKIFFIFKVNPEGPFPITILVGKMLASSFPSLHTEQEVAVRVSYKFRIIVAASNLKHGTNGSRMQALLA